MKKILMTLALIAALGGFLGTANSLDKRYAKQTELSALSDRLELQILEDELRIIKERIYHVEDRWTKIYYERHNKYPETNAQLVAIMTEEYKELYRTLLEEKATLESKIKKLKEKK